MMSPALTTLALPAKDSAARPVAAPYEFTVIAPVLVIVASPSAETKMPLAPYPYLLPWATVMLPELSTLAVPPRPEATAEIPLAPK